MAGFFSVQSAEYRVQLWNPTLLKLRETGI